MDSFFSLCLFGRMESRQIFLKEKSFSKRNHHFHPWKDFPPLESHAMPSEISPRAEVLEEDKVTEALMSKDYGRRLIKTQVCGGAGWKF